MCELDDGLGDGGVLGVGAEVLDEGAIDFERVDGEAFEVGEGGVAGAKVIDGELDADVVEGVECGDGFFFVPHDDALGEFEFERARGQLGVLESAFDDGGEVAFLELSRGAVDGDFEVFKSGFVPAFGLFACLVHDPLAEFEDEVEFFGDRDEFGGGNQAILGVLPAQEGLKADDGLGFEAELGLVVEGEFFAFDGLSDGGGHLEEDDGVDVHGRGEDLEAVAAPAFGLVERGVSVAQDFFGFFVFAFAQDDADAHGSEEFFAAEVEGVYELGLDVACELFGLFVAVCAVEEDDKLVATEACEGDVVGEDVAQSGGDLDQELVSGGVSEGVVDHLEAVEVEEEGGEGLEGAFFDGADALGQTLHEERAVG